MIDLQYIDFNFLHIYINYNATKILKEIVKSKFLRWIGEKNFIYFERIEDFNNSKQKIDSSPQHS